MKFTTSLSFLAVAITVFAAESESDAAKTPYFQSAIAAQIALLRENNSIESADQDEKTTTSVVAITKSIVTSHASKARDDDSSVVSLVLEVDPKETSISSAVQSASSEPVQNDSVVSIFLNHETKQTQAKSSTEEKSTTDAKSTDSSSATLLEASSTESKGGACVMNPGLVGAGGLAALAGVLLL